jgi:surface antigen/LysM repeat protein
VVVNRYVTHGVVLLVVLLLSGYASVGRNLPGMLNLRLGAVNADGLVMGEGGRVGGVEMGRASTIIAPVAIPVSAPVSHEAVTYEVKSGETLKDLAARFQVSTDDIRWSNLTALKSLTKDVSAGQKIVIPPVDGLVVVAQKGDTALSLSSTYHVASQAIVDFNYLRTSDQDPLPAGALIVIPGGRGPDLSPAPAPARTAGGVGTGGYTLGGFSGSYSVAPGNRFPYGYCTWYVYNRKPVPWLGNAIEWFGQAQAYGWATGQTPKPGAIMVTTESYFGHVAYVESVAPDGSSWTVSEMNFTGWGIVDTRTIRRGYAPVLGFIY